MRNARRLTTKHLSTAILLFFACDGPGLSWPEQKAKIAAFTRQSLEPFASEEAFDAYTAVLADTGRTWGGGLYGCASSRESAPALLAKDDSAAPGAAAGDESITNNQEASVDEGGIVKASGDFFVVLRRGRLFSLRHTKEQAATLERVSTVDAYPPGSHLGSWYDEMLIDGDRVVVIGYSYNASATELGFFRLSPDGVLSYDATYFLPSNDYYSSRNYASRLKDGQLILYMPDALMQWRNGRYQYSDPTLGRWGGGNNIDRQKPLVDKTRVYQPIVTTTSPVMHKLVQCDLRAAEITCDARAVLGGWSRVSYVSAAAAYLWIADDDSDSTAQVRPSTLYRLPLDPNEPVGAVQTLGMPIDQLSFDEDAQGGVLNVLVQTNGQGEAMFGAERKNTALALLQLPLAQFAAKAAAPAPSRYTPLPSSDIGYNFHNRFVGKHLLYGAGTPYWYGVEGNPDQVVYVIDLATPGTASTLQLGHGVDRIEALGDGGAFVSGEHIEMGQRNQYGYYESDRSLVMSTVALTPTPVLKTAITTASASQGESRSHGFFFKSDPDGGIAALPVRHEGGDYANLRWGSAEVAFMRVTSELELAPFGALASSPEAAQDDSCQVSCVDWYGNARPIFFRGRLFALLGYELVEGGLAQAGIVERSRLDFTP